MRRRLDRAGPRVLQEIVGLGRVAREALREPSQRGRVLEQVTGFDPSVHRASQDARDCRA
jgi:hypothetical protein